MASELKSKVKGFISDVKTHWSKPAEGRYVPYKEYLDIFVGVGSNYAGSKTLEYIFFASSCFLIMHHYKLPYLTFSVIGIINMPLGYIWTLIWWYVCDNLGFLKKKTERTLYLIYFLLIVVGLTLILAPVANLFDPNSAIVTYMNSLEGISFASAFKILGTHILYNGWVGARNIFWRKKLLPKFGRYKYGLYCDVIPKCIMVVLIGWLPLYNDQALPSGAFHYGDHPARHHRRPAREVGRYKYVPLGDPGHVHLVCRANDDLFRPHQRAHPAAAAREEGFY